MINRFLDQRFKFLFDLKRDNNLDCLILHGESNIRYFTDFVSSNAYLLVFREEILIITDSRYRLELEEVDGRIVRKVAGDPLDVLKRLIDYKPESIGCDDDLIASSLGKTLRRSKIKIVNVSQSVDEFISVADDETMVRFEYANSITKSIEKNLSNLLTPGMREFELRAAISYFIHLSGCEEAFTPIVSFGENSAKIHTEPSEKQLEKESPVLIDFGVKYKGVSTDVTRSFWYGKNPADEYQKVYKIVKKSLKMAVQHCKAGNDTSNAFHAAKNWLLDNHNNPEECLPHSLGHGLGYEVHQHPKITSRSGTKFKANQIITLEPGIYIPGKFGIRIENDYLITKDGTRLLTK